VKPSDDSNRRSAPYDEREEGGRCIRVCAWVGESQEAAAILAELRSRGVEVLGDAFDLDAIGRLGFLKDNNDDIIELASR
jgi:hypothetical protein